MKRLVLFAAVCMVMMPGCTESEKISSENGLRTQTLTFSAVNLGDDDTRSGLGSDRKSVLFRAGDAISLLSTTNSSSGGARLTTAVGTVSGTAAFKGEGNTDTRYYAVYPYTAGASFVPGTIKGLSVPSVQKATAESYDSSAVITYAATSDQTLQFKNLCSLLKIRVPAAASGIVVTVPGEGPALTGSVSIDTGTAPGELRRNESCLSREVKLEGNIEKDKLYYISVIPGTYEELTVTAYSGTGDTRHIISTRHKAESFTISKGVIYDMGTLTETRGISATDNKSGRSLCGWVRLWAGGPKWAEFNLGSKALTYSGATSVNSDVCGKYYTWGGKTSRDLSDDYVKTTVTSLPDASETAALIWGNGWKMPSRTHLEDLISYCDWEWCDGTSGHQYVSGCTICGYKISGRGADYSMNSIFLPAAGLWSTPQPAGVNEYCYYWSSSAEENDNTNAYGIFSYLSTAPTEASLQMRSSGFSIRPVMP